MHFEGYFVSPSERDQNPEYPVYRKQDRFKLFCGFICGLVVDPFRSGGTTRCPNCRGHVWLAGRHFNPSGSKNPHWLDLVFSVFLVSNAFLWRFIAHALNA